MKNVLVIAAHPDDELLGVGGTIRKLANQGVCCRAVILAEGITSRADKRSDADTNELVELQKDARKAAEIVGYSSIDFCQLPDNRMDGMELLDVIKVVSKYVEKYNPDTIFTHHHGDLNIDHRIACEAVITACRPVGKYGVNNISQLYSVKLKKEQTCLEHFGVQNPAQSERFHPLHQSDIHCFSFSNL